MGIGKRVGTLPIRAILDFLVVTATGRVDAARPQTDMNPLHHCVCPLVSIS